MRLALMIIAGVAVGFVAGAIAATYLRSPASQHRVSAAPLARSAPDFCSAMTRAVSIPLQRNTPDRYGTKQADPAQVARIYSHISSDLNDIDPAGSNAFQRFRTALAKKEDMVRDHSIQILGKRGQYEVPSYQFDTDISQSWDILEAQELITSDETCAATCGSFESPAHQLLSYPQQYIDPKVPASGRFADMLPVASGCPQVKAQIGEPA